MSEEKAGYVILGIILIAAIIGIGIVGFQHDRLEDEIAELRQEAIDLNYAQYNPKTGNWEWIRPQ